MVAFFPLLGEAKQTRIFINHIGNIPGQSFLRSHHFPVYLSQ